MTDIRIVYFDPYIVVLEKESGMLSVPGRGPDKEDSVSARIRAIFPESIEQPSVHRLDMDTSGLMVYALTAEAHRDLSIQFQERIVRKRYISLVDGHVAGTSGEINLPFRLDVDNRPYQVYDPVHGKPGKTIWRKVAVEGDVTRVEYTPLTGRTHQLRVHSSHPLGLGCSISGDRLYGDGGSASRLMLHASCLGFSHPVSGEYMEFHSEVPF